MLHGRVAEAAEIARVLATAAAGHGTALVIRGEAGIGKSALLDHVARSASHMRVLRAGCVESEAGMPYAALHLLLRPALDRIDGLPEPQAAALRAAFGLSGTVVPDQRLVGYAITTLLSRLATERPLVCLIDDAHGLDRESAGALALAARRLHTEAAAMVFAADDECPGFPATGLRELRLERLDGNAARELLARCPSELSAHTRERILDESDGNPMALLELAAALSPRQRFGHLPPEVIGLGALPVRGDAYAPFTSRIGRLPPSTRTLLGAVAADGRGELTVILHAAHSLGTSIDDLAVAERARLVVVADGRVGFRHPLIRPAAYHGVTITSRVVAHTALAQAYEAFGDEPASVWHRAAAATGPDERVAEHLEQLAECRPADHGRSVAAAAYQCAAELSSSMPNRGRRLAAAAVAASASGDLRRAAALADQALSMTGDDGVLARLAMIRAAAEAEAGLLRDAAWILLQGAAVVAEAAPDLAAAMLMTAARHAWACDYREALGLAATRVAVLRTSDTVRVCAAGIRGLAGLAGHDAARGMASLRRMILAAADGRPSLPIEVRLHVAEAALLVGDDGTARDLLTRLVATCRAQGRDDVLPHVLGLLAQAQLFLGLHQEARISGEQALEIARRTGIRQLPGQVHATLSRIAAVEGDEENSRDLAQRALSEGPTSIRQWAVGSRALLDLGLGRAEEAMERLSEDAPGWRTVVGPALLADTVEACARSGHRSAARVPLERLDEAATHSGTEWIRAVALRCHAMTSDDGAAGDLFAQAVFLHRQAPTRPFEQARTELAYGEWLRRSRRRTDARVYLRSALGIFDRIGAAPWTDRARAELRATGESRPQPRGEEVGGLATLTAQERMVTQLAATGLSNQEIAVRMSISPRTVGYHLYKAYPKLGITKRIELARLDLAASA
ncbi:helix-turn-helix transcriptional regulator [Phytoactinopolyspora alkaliphila]|nr:LuxR family transcriptional regulator [Phytoactinopolyspora alkaliphila]